MDQNKGCDQNKHQSRCRGERCESRLKCYSCYYGDAGVRGRVGWVRVGGVDISHTTSDWTHKVLSLSCQPKNTQLCTNNLAKKHNRKHLTCQNLHVVKEKSLDQVSLNKKQSIFY